MRTLIGLALVSFLLGCGGETLPANDGADGGLPVCADPCSGCVGHVPAPSSCAPPICADSCRH